jgi:hypothetical protein
MALNLLLSRVVLAAVVVVTSASEAVAQPFVGLASVFHNVVTGVGQTLSGYGKVDSINGVPIRESLCSNCELTYRFGNYVASSISASEVKFTGGYMSLYLGKKKKQDELNPYASSSSAEDLAAATDGTLVLTLSGHAIDAAGNTLTATGVNIGGAVPMGFAAGLVDVDLTGNANGNTAGPGGSWNARFATNGIPALFGGGNADLQIGWTASGILPPHPSECTSGQGPACVSGALDLRAVTDGPVNGH